MKHILFALVSTLLLAVIIFAVGAGGQKDMESDASSMMEGSLETVMDSTPPVLPPGFEGKEYMKPMESELKKKLTPLEFQVTQHEGTEPAFNNMYWDYKGEGIFVDIVSGEPLFSSTDKYKSGTGWPSFTRPLESGNIISVTDKSFGMVRTEVRSKYADSHLGHLFNDGPQPSGLRYCINSASLRFVPKENLEQEGYAKYLELF